MTATVAAPAPVVEPRRVGLTRGYRFELVKLLSLWRVRLLIVTAWLGRAVVVAAAAKQGILPADTPFGRWLHATGWAAPLVGLGFSGMWALPLLTSVVAGEMFAAEGPLGTWRHLLVASIGVSLSWAVAATALAYRLFLRRDFISATYDGAGRRILVAGILPMAAQLAVAVGVIAVAAPGRPARVSSRPNWSVRLRQRSPTYTGCKPSSCTAPTLPKRGFRPARPVTRGRRGREQRPWQRLVLRGDLAPSGRRGGGKRHLPARRDFRPSVLR